MTRTDEPATATAPGATTDVGPVGKDGDRDAMVRARRELLGHVEAINEPVMAVLGVVFVGLVALPYTSLPLTGGERAALARGQGIIYGVFVADFAVRLLVTPDKSRFLRRNALVALSVFFPMLRPVHALRAVAAIPSGHLLRAIAGLNRWLQAIRQVTRGRQFAYLMVVSLVLVVVAAGAVFFVERDAAGSDIRTLGESLWWAATLVTTINSADDPVTFEGRIVGLLLRLYAVTVFGYLTASIATFLIGGRRPSGTSAGERPSGPPRAEE